MGTVHELLLREGKSATLSGTGFSAKGEEQAARDRRAVAAAASYMADEGVGVGFLFSGWAQAALPHRGLAPDAVWQITTDRISLIVEPGRRRLEKGELEWVGVPYGSRARLIMLYLQTEALRTQSREVVLGASLNAWLKPHLSPHFC